MATRKPIPAPYPEGYEPFLAAIQAALAADVPRLAFADWLDEHDDHDRAEFIRLQCEFTRWDGGGLTGNPDELDPRRLSAAERKSVRRLEELFEAHQARWLAGFPAWAVRGANWTRYQRGFISRFQCGPKQLTNPAWAEVRRVTPLETVWVGKLSGAEDAVLRSNVLAGVADLYLLSADGAALSALAGSPILPSLRLLHLAGGGQAVAPAVYAALFGSAQLARVRDLSITHFRHGDAIAAAVAGSAHLRELRTLTLNGTRLGPAGFEQLVTAPVLGGVTDLNMRGNPVGDAGVRALTGSAHAKKIEALDLGYCKLGPAAAQLLADWKGLQSLQSLRIDGNHLRAEGLSALGASPHATALREIDLSAEGVTREEWATIERLPVFARIADADAFAFNGAPDFD